MDVPTGVEDDTLIIEIESDDESKQPHSIVDPSFSVEQNEALAMFQSIAPTCSYDNAKSYLKSSNWIIENALDSFFQSSK